MFENLLKAGKGTLRKKLTVIAGTTFGILLASTLLSKDEDEVLDDGDFPELEEIENDEDTSDESEDE